MPTPKRRRRRGTGYKKEENKFINQQKQGCQDILIITYSDNPQALIN